MRQVHLVLLGIIAVVAIIAVAETRPEMGGNDPATRDRVHLAYWEKWGSFEADACQAMVDDFNASQDEIFVHYLRTSEVDRKSMLAIIGKIPPDILGIWDYNLPPFAEGGALLPLDERMARSGISPDDYIPNYLKMCRHNGRTYALPTSPATVALFYNKEHFRRKAAELRTAGLDPERAPDTIEELDRYAAVLNEFDASGKPVVMGFLPTEPGWFHHTWGYYFGGKLFDERTKTFTAADAHNIDAFLWLKRYAECYDRERLLRFRSGFGTFDSPQNAFLSGKVSMVMHGVWFPNFIRRHRPHMEFGVAPFPCAKDVPGPRSMLEADLICIPRGCRHPEEAWKFVEYVQKHGLIILCRLQGKHLPLAHTPAIFRQGHPNLELDVFQNLGAAPDSFVCPRLVVWGEYRPDMNRAFEHIWNWPVPEEELAGLEGDARQRKLEALCRAEIEKTLREVDERLQERYDRMIERERLRPGELVR